LVFVVTWFVEWQTCWIGLVASLKNIVVKYTKHFYLIK
jgi:hypothetical protein